MLFKLAVVLMLVAVIVSLFSGLNNLNDITVDAAYSAICGYTDDDVDTVFAPELPGLDRAQIRTWYNGYNWLGESFYNPFDLLLHVASPVGARAFNCDAPDQGNMDLLLSVGTAAQKERYLAPHYWDREV